MSYAVKEIFMTLQGEGAHSGRAAVFCRFSGCNLWSGREEDRETAMCSFCDTDFVGVDGPAGGRFADSDALAEAVEREWSGPLSNRYVVLTGGEPLLQVDSELIESLHARGFEVGVETNGTKTAPAGLDWVCVSPKHGSELVLKQGNELKLVFPQPGLEPTSFEGYAFDHFFLQPMDSLSAASNLKAAIAYCIDNPHWRLSLQSHKMIGIR